MGTGSCTGWVQDPVKDGYRVGTGSCTDRILYRVGTRWVQDKYRMGAGWVQGLYGWVQGGYKTLPDKLIESN